MRMIARFWLMVKALYTSPVVIYRSLQSSSEDSGSISGLCDGSLCLCVDEESCSLGWRALDPRPSLDLGGDNPRLRRRHLILEAWFLFSFQLSFHYGFQSFEACTTCAVLSKTLPDLRIVERCMKYC